MSQQDGQSRRRRSPRVSSSSSRSNESLHSIKANGNEVSKTPSKDTPGRKGNFSKKGVYRTSSHDQVRKLVEKEGRTARNLVTWSVPVNTIQDEERAKRNKSRLMARKRQTTPEKSGSSEREFSPANKSGSKSPNRGRSGRKTSQSSTGKKSDLRARYWSYLFDNLKRAVDEIYSTCETDESTVECEEVIMMLDQCRRDFAALIERICVQDAFEKADYKDRPTSLAWEVRKSSPGKSLVTSPCTVQIERSAQSPVRSLDFSNARTTSTAIAPKPTIPVQANSTLQNGPSWADRVKGTSATKIVPSSTTAFTTSHALRDENRTTMCSPDIDEGTDEEGWETVRHGKKHTPQGNHSNGRTNHMKKQNSHEKAPQNDNRGSQNKSWNSVEVEIHSQRTNHNHIDHLSEKTGNLNGTLRTNHNQIKSVVLNSAEPKGMSNGVSYNERHSKLNPNLLSPPNERKISLTSEEDEELAVPLDDSDVEKEIELEAEHEKAMSDAIQEELTLSKEIEEWQKQALASAIEHEESLNREIETVEAFVTALNGETPTSELETETEGEGEGDCNSGDAGDASLEDSGKSMTWDELVANYESKRESGESPSWGDTAETSEERHPGRAVAMHQKLSAPSRKRPLAEKIRIHEEKQYKARQQRERLLEERLQKLQSLSEKVKNVRELQEDLIESRQEYLAEKQKRAENRRKTMLQVKVRKAQEEEAKVNEIAFINTLEAQNKKMEVMSRIQEHAARLQDLQEEKKRKKREEQQAKETAAQERRRQLEAERLARLEEVQQRKMEQEAKYKKEKMEKEKAREEAAREKARHVEMRIAAKKEALQTATEQLQMKIKQKQTDHTRRHEQQLEQVKEKAAGISRHPTQEEVPAVTPYETKKICTLCNVEIISDVYLYSHLRGNRHQQALLESSIGSKNTNEDKETMSLHHIREITKDQAEQQEKADLERRKALKKRAKKLRTRMAAKGREYESALSSTTPLKQDSAKRVRLQKIVKDVNRYLQVQGTGPWPTNRVTSLDRSVGEIIRMVDEKADKITFCNLGGLSALARVLLVVDITDIKAISTTVISNRVLCHVVKASTLICKDCRETSQYMVFTNKLSSLVDLLSYQLRQFCSIFSNHASKKTTDKENKDTPRCHSDPLVSALFDLLATVLESLVQPGNDEKLSPTTIQRNTDLISYIVCCDLVDDIRGFLTSIQEPFDDDNLMVDMVYNCMKLLSAVALFIPSRTGNMFEPKKEDATQFIATFQQTELVGIISTLYTMILSSGQARHFSPPPPLPDYQIKIATEGLRALNNMACVDLKALQTSLGSEGISLEFRHIVSYLLWICGEGSPEDLLHEVILIVGYFTVLNQENQIFIQSGRSPTLLQQLCGLPFQYFSDPRLRNILFPTLIASCYENGENKTIIEQEVSCALLENFIQDKILDTQQDSRSASKAMQDEAVPDRFTLERRFPRSLWSKAAEFLVGTST